MALLLAFSHEDVAINMPSARIAVPAGTYILPQAEDAGIN